MSRVWLRSFFGLNGLPRSTLYVVSIFITKNSLKSSISQKGDLIEWSLFVFIESLDDCVGVLEMVDSQSIDEVFVAELY